MPPALGRFLRISGIGAAIAFVYGLARSARRPATRLPRPMSRLRSVFGFSTANITCATTASLFFGRATPWHDPAL